MRAISASLKCKACEDTVKSCCTGPFWFMSDRPAHAVPLPHELLICIFDLATDSPARDIDALAELRTFEGDYSADVDWLCDAPLKTKHALALTCSLFRKLSTRFLYEDIRIGHGSEGLADALERDYALGLLVKRVSISLPGFKAEGHWCASFPTSSRRILEKCTNVVVLTRPQGLLTDVGELQENESILVPPSAEISLDDILLPRLRRVDWFNSPIDLLPSTLPTPKFIWNSNSLETLTVGPDYFPLQLTDSPIVDLPCVHTLRLRSLHTPGDVDDSVDPESVRLPALRRLVFSLPDAIYTLFFEQFLRACGPKIETIEIASHPRFLKHDFISVLLLNCSNTTTLNFPIFTTKPTRKNTRRQAVDIVYPVTHVGLRAAGFQESEDVGNEDSQWTLLVRHFLALFGERTRFSKLEKVMLYGEEWDWMLSDPRCRGALKLLKSKDVEIVCEHESVAAALKSVCEGLDF